MHNLEYNGSLAYDNQYKFYILDTLYIIPKTFKYSNMAKNSHFILVYIYIYRYFKIRTKHINIFKKKFQNSLCIDSIINCNSLITFHINM